MEHLKVKLWNKEIGRLVWEPTRRRTYFVFNPDHINEVPDIVPILSPKTRRNLLIPVYGDERPLYQGLPPFIADSLPDSWGNTLFDKWVKDNRVPRNKITPLYKLMFIGPRGMGALEYEPCASELTHNRNIDIKSLYDMSVNILENRDDIALNLNEELTLQALLAVGTSAGGRQMKAVIAINDNSGEIRSGQTNGLDGFDYYIVKFGDNTMPVAEIETAYYHMAKRAGIEMENSRLFSVEGINHFMTRRFDRVDGKKIYVQTLAAINPEARSYEDFVATCRELSLPESEIEQLFTRMVFNVMANNTDDHNKNFSFLLGEDGKWHLAPAYDVTFIFNNRGNGPNIIHMLSICGKIAEITKADLLEFAHQNDIKNANAIISNVADALCEFDQYATMCNITRPWRGIIQMALIDNLVAFGFRHKSEEAEAQNFDKFGRAVKDIKISVNSKGHYEISAQIDGKMRRRFIRQNMPVYADLNRQDIYSLTAHDIIRLVELVFPCD